MAVGLLGTAVSGLQAFQRNLETTSHNISNVDTEGYSRQRVDLESRPGTPSGAGFIGSGVDARATERLFDDFLSAQVRSSTSANAQLQAYHEFASLVDNRLADSNTGLSPVIQEFFNAVQGLADDPASIPSRQVVLSQADILVDRFQTLNQHFEDLRTRLNGEIDNLLHEINSRTAAIADLNDGIQRARALAGGQEPNDLLDKRDQLINELAEQVAVTVLEQDDGSVNLLMGNGQALVVGSTAVTLSTQPDALDPSHSEILAGSVPITQSLVGGRIGGFVEFREQILDPSQNALGRVAVGIAQDFNSQHGLGLDLDGNLGGDFFQLPAIQVLPDRNNTLPGATVTAAYSNSDDLTTSDYSLRYDGGTNYTLMRLSDAQTFAVDTAVPASLANDGFTLNIGVGATMGDRFLIQPTRNGGAEIDRAITDVRRVAVAGAVRAGEFTDVNGIPTNTGTAVITQPSTSNTSNVPLSGVSANGSLRLTFDASSNQFNIVPDPALVGPLAYDPAADSAGKAFTLAAYGGMTFTLSGAPADNDAFVIADNSGAISDNRNGLLLAQLQTKNTLAGGTVNYQAAYGQVLSQVGTQTHQADINRKAQEGLLGQAREAMASVSGVNLDEEAANLVRFQQAYQASAQVISVADTLFQTLLGVVGR